uniref:Sortilin-related receptor n=1 Tax=Schistosoma mansoni TaxID=6183 RepID=A0A5K4FA04_SCHMA
MVNLITSLHTVNGQHEPAYLETNMIANDRNTNTFRVIQEQTAFMAFEWKPMAHKDFNYVFLVQDVYFWSDVTAKVYEGNMGLLEAIGEPCEVSKYRAEGHNGNIFFSHFQTYDITYKRVPRIENVQIGLLSIITSLHTVNGQHEPAYLETNMIANDRNTNTFRVIQEQTAFMAFEWKPMAHKDFNYVFLVQDVYFWSDVTAKVYEGNMGLLEAIGEPCEVSKYRAEGHNGNIFFSHFQTYDITYKRVPRIENVQIGLLSSPYRHLMWKRERSACEPTDSTIIFRGYSTQQLQMFTISSDKVEHYVKDFQTEEGIEEVFILFNKHGNRFSLPTMGNILLRFLLHCKIFLANKVARANQLPIAQMFFGRNTCEQMMKHNEI